MEERRPCGWSKDLPAVVRRQQGDVTVLPADTGARADCSVSSPPRGRAAGGSGRGRGAPLPGRPLRRPCARGQAAKPLLRFPTRRCGETTAPGRDAPRTAAASAWCHLLSSLELAKPDISFESEDGGPASPARAFSQAAEQAPLAVFSNALTWTLQAPFCSDIPPWGPCALGRGPAPRHGTTPLPEAGLAVGRNPRL